MPRVSTDLHRYVSNSPANGPLLALARTRHAHCAHVTCLAHVGRPVMDVRDDVRAYEVIAAA
jgi:hypothetical protein